MDGNVKYASLKEAVDSLNTYAKNLSTPIDNYIRQTSQIGEDGAAWGGTVAIDTLPVLEKIKADIVQLQAACDEFSNNVMASLVSYSEADAANMKKIQDVANM